ncbi:MAG: hypothetical protein AB7H90_03440 [Alphaproteobacteria bacterium]
MAYRKTEDGSVRVSEVRVFFWTENVASAGSAILMEDGFFLLQEDNSRILLETAGSAPDLFYLLMEDGSFLLLEDGSRIVLE